MMFQKDYVFRSVLITLTIDFRQITGSDNSRFDIDLNRIMSCKGLGNIWLGVCWSEWQVNTAESFGTPRRLHAIQSALIRRSGSQCGTYTSGSIERVLNSHMA
eukprot:6467878-Amphidinium_carterae.1